MGPKKVVALQNIKRAYLSGSNRTFGGFKGMSNYTPTQKFSAEFRRFGIININADTQAKKVLNDDKLTGNVVEETVCIDVRSIYLSQSNNNEENVTQKFLEVLDKHYGERGIKMVIDNDKATLYFLMQADNLAIYKKIGAAVSLTPEKEEKVKPCPTPASLRNYVYGSASEKRKEQIEKHMEECEECPRLISEFRLQFRKKTKSQEEIQKKSFPSS